ncbi:hypothetical protein BU204_24370 [Actinophytocola xanthii]|uniref:Uncharacterized protein n=2 Tax=Actinophytocola xanthii TaxID=1912961 RepID=A0A1Q8CKJ4_9PSEU|nr:hypothetical protein BU204_24370 [Actinophytocola xanthii]
MADSEVTVRLLGEVLVNGDALPDLLANLLIALSLAPDRRLPVYRLAEVWPDGQRPTDIAVHKAMSRLRDYVPLPAQRNRYYRIELDDGSVDADVFVAGVKALPNTADPAKMNELLELWDGDPRQHYPVTRKYWYRVYQARAELLKKLAHLSPPDLRSLSALATFLNHFPSTEIPAGLWFAASESGRTPGRKRVLIVEDQIGDDFASMLAPRYDYVILRSLADWHKFVVDEPLDFDVALVDLHLTSSSTDMEGIVVLEYLRDNTPIPTLLISGAPLPGDTEATRRQYKLSGVFLKGPDNSLPTLPDSVERAIREGRPRD